MTTHTNVHAFSFHITPTPTPAAAQSLYLKEAGDTADISVHDINQGQVGDCFLLAAIGEIALFAPNAIKSMIQVNADGTETVTLHGGAHGALPGYGATPTTLILQKVSNSFAANGVNNGAGQATAGGKKEIWAQVLEKAYAQAAGGTGLNTLAPISNGGSPIIALEALTGHAASWQTAQSLDFKTLAADVRAGDLIVFDTKANPLEDHLIGGHAYMFEGLSGTGDTASITMGNPWGNHQPDAVSFAQVARNFCEVDVCHV